MLDDPRIQSLAGALAGTEPRLAKRDGDPFEAGVLLAIRPRDELELLIIKRAEIEGDPWSGHMALPGGRRDTDDTDLLATALRETEEETGVAVPAEAVLGRLDEVRPRSRRLVPLIIAPFVAVVDPSTRAAPAPAEVDQVLWIPLGVLGSDEAVSEVVIDLEDESRAFPSLTYNEHVIWGLTHRVLMQFLEIGRTAGVV